MSILKNFIKYQSLGNDFVVFDWYKKPSVFMQQELLDSTWKQFIVRICDRHYGVGADGVLIITGNAAMGMPEMLIFNADGSQAETCLNGARCVAHYLFTNYHFPEHFFIKLGARQAECFVSQAAYGSENCQITMNIGSIDYRGQQTLVCDDKNFNGHCVSVGNPHFIIFEQTTLPWLACNGKAIESHEQFPNKTNVEFVWESAQSSATERIFDVLVYERGCGITLACGSGATAVTGLLANQGLINTSQRIALKMPGGVVTAWVDADGSVFLQAAAQLIFSGIFEDHIEEYRQLRPQLAGRI